MLRLKRATDGRTARGSARRNAAVRRELNRREVPPPMGMVECVDPGRVNPVTLAPVPGTGGVTGYRVHAGRGSTTVAPMATPMVAVVPVTPDRPAAAAVAIASAVAADYGGPDGPGRWTLTVDLDGGPGPRVHRVDPGRRRRGRRVDAGAVKRAKGWVRG